MASIEQQEMKVRKKGWNQWSDAEKLKFQELIPQLQCKYNEYLQYFPNRNYTQIKSYYHNLKRQQRKKQALLNGSYQSNLDSSITNDSTLPIMKQITTAQSFEVAPPASQFQALCNCSSVEHINSLPIPQILTLYDLSSESFTGTPVIMQNIDSDVPINSFSQQGASMFDQYITDNLDSFDTDL